MALSFENTFSEVDFMPSIDEMKEYMLMGNFLSLKKKDLFCVL